MGWQVASVSQTLVRARRILATRAKGLPKGGQLSEPRGGSWPQWVGGCPEDLLQPESALGHPAHILGICLGHAAERAPFRPSLRGVSAMSNQSLLGLIGGRSLHGRWTGEVQPS